MPPLLSFPLTLLSLIGYHKQTNLLSIFIVQINMVKYWNGACCLGVHFFNDKGCRPRSHFFQKRGTCYVRILCEGLDFEIWLSSNLSLSLLWTYMVFYFYSYLIFLCYKEKSMGCSLLFHQPEGIYGNDRKSRPRLIELTSFKPKLLIRFIINKTC